MKIVISGASGFIGAPLVRFLRKQGHVVIVLTRRLQASGGKQAGLFLGDRDLEYVLWNPDDEDGMVREIDGADAVINLAGENIAAKRWSAKQKNLILESRVRATETIVRSIKTASTKPKVLINASAVGYYGSCGERTIDENTPSGGDFLAWVARAWEKGAMEAERFGVRVVRLRMGMVLDPSGGALRKMLPAFRFGLGGPIGGGQQWMSWVHLQDLIALIEFALRNGDVSGPLNAVSPKAVTNREFSETLARVLKKPCWFPVPAFVLKLALGEVSQLVLASHRAVPKKALELGFEFKMPDLERALQQLVSTTSQIQSPDPSNPGRRGV